MKNFRVRKTLFCLVMVALMLSILLPTSVISQFNYDTPIPLGAEVDLIAGLSDEEIKIATENYYKSRETEYSKLENIRYNFMQSSEKYYGGAYWEGEAYFLDEKGNPLLDENGAPHLNYNRILYILVTDLKVVPKTNAQNLFFREVKYSETELINYIDTLNEKFLSEGLVAVGLRTLENKIEITLLEGFDINKFEGIVPKDAYYVSFVKDAPTIMNFMALPNAGKVTQPPGDCSVGFPVQFGSSGASKGWLTTGHGATSGTVTYDGNTLGTLGNANASGLYDAATILRTNTAYRSSHQGPFGYTIDLQESTTASLPIVGTSVQHQGFQNGPWWTSIVSNYEVIGGNTLVVMNTTGLVHAAEGDSGGPVIRYGGSNDTTAMGLIKGMITGTTHTYAGKVVYSRLRHMRNGITGLSVAAFS